VLGVPLAARGRLHPVGLVALASLAAAVAVAVGALLLSRALARPVERILAAADRLGGAERSFPILQPQGETASPSPARAAVAFERVAAALVEERAALAAKVAELESANRALAQARESWLRSERLAAVGRLAAGIAHEVGNPLGAIGGFAELARDRLRGAAPEVEDLMSRIAAEAERIDRIVRDLLEFARPSPPARSPVSLPAVADAAQRLARVQPRFREVEAAFAWPPDLPAALADEGRLVQVFLNLFLNAGDAMGGRGSVQVRGRAAEGGVEVEVADRGPGIAPEHLAQVFDPFFTTKAPGAGTGLGLSVCHRLIEVMGGRIDAGNAPEGGAVFRLWLPAAAERRPDGEKG